MPIGYKRTIAEALSDVDMLLELLDALVAKTRAIKEGIMQQLITDRTRLVEPRHHFARKQASP